MKIQSVEIEKVKDGTDCKSAPAGHESVHIRLYNLGITNIDAHEAAAYKWSKNQAGAWGLSGMENFYYQQYQYHYNRYHYLHPHQQSIRINRPINPFK
jgi:hypothetical protein